MIKAVSTRPILDPAILPDGSNPVEEKIDPEKLLVELKMREAILKRLENEGHNTKDVSKMRIELENTIEELEGIIQVLS